MTTAYGEKDEGKDTVQPRPTDSTLRSAMLRRLQRRAVVSGEMTLPAVPGMLEEYVTLCDETFIALGVRFAEEELADLRAALKSQLDEAYSASPRSEIVITYEFPYGLEVGYNVRASWYTLAGAYDNWVATREPPYFGTEPDARVCALAAEAVDPAAFPVLDIGAGTGRNSLALARRGHPVDAVEMTAAFADSLRAAAARESLNVRVIASDVFATGSDELRRDYRLIVLSEVVSDFRSIEQLRRVFELAARALAPGGYLVFNVFLAKSGYIPDDAARELGQQCYATIFTPAEVFDAASLLPLDLVADDSVYEYEKAHQPAESWPPTSWYEDWVNGQDVFEVPREESPIEMRWRVYRRAW